MCKLSAACYLSKRKYWKFKICEKLQGFFSSNMPCFIIIYYYIFIANCKNSYSEVNVKQCQSKLAKESTEATSTIVADKLFHLVMVLGLLGKSCVHKDDYSSAGIICYIISSTKLCKILKSIVNFNIRLLRCNVNLDSMAVTLL